MYSVGLFWARVQLPSILTSRSSTSKRVLGWLVSRRKHHQWRDKSFLKLLTISGRNIIAGIANIALVVSLYSWMISWILLNITTKRIKMMIVKTVEMSARDNQPWLLSCLKLNLKNITWQCQLQNKDFVTKKSLSQQRQRWGWKLKHPTRSLQGCIWIKPTFRCSELKKYCHKSVIFWINLYLWLWRCLL